MSINAITSNHIPNFKTTNSSSGPKRASAPIGDKAIEFIEKKPALVSGIFLMLGTFCISFSKSLSRLSPLLGIPALLAFVHEMFFNTNEAEDTIELLQKEITAKAHYPYSPSPTPMPPAPPFAA